MAGKGKRKRYDVRAYDATPVPTARQRHVLDRLGCGFSVASFKQLRKAGGELAWFEQQLRPDAIAESPEAAAVPVWFPTLSHLPAVVYANDRAKTYGSWEYARDLANASIVRRICSTRSLFESMVELWSNHLHVDAGHFPGFAARLDYDAVIRKHALGTFEDLLVATTLHPAMLMFLDNWKSKKNAPNENHGRELLELHTVGRDAGYTEAMVKDSARILSGHTVSEVTWGAVYDPARHTTGAVHVLGFTDPNAGADPRLAERYLRYLAHHPATARRICRKLAIRFVSDDPSDALVERLAKVFLDSGTDLKATLRALVDSEEFWASAGQKVRTPVDDLVATCRVLRVVPAAPVDRSSFVNELVWALNSVLPFRWPRPDGPPDQAATWANTTRMLNSFQMHWGLAGGWWPNGQVRFRRPTAFLPAAKLPFDQLVDHLSRVILGRRATPTLLQAACQGCDVGPTETITRSHAVMAWKFPRLIAVLLDSPAHMTR